jgi:hypothetical protein
MHSLILLNTTDQLLSVEGLRQIFSSVEGFQRMRTNTPVSNPIEADFQEGDNFTTVELDENRKWISIRGTSGAAVSAAWILKVNLDVPLRIFDTANFFDLMMSDFSSREQLEKAIDRARWL